MPLCRGRGRDWTRAETERERDDDDSALYAGNNGNHKVIQREREQNDGWKWTPVMWPLRHTSGCWWPSAQWLSSTPSLGQLKKLFVLPGQRTWRMGSRDRFTSSENGTSCLDRGENWFRVIKVENYWANRDSKQTWKNKRKRDSRKSRRMRLDFFGAQLLRGRSEDCDWLLKENNSTCFKLVHFHSWIQCSSCTVMGSSKNKNKSIHLLTMTDLC